MVAKNDIRKVMESALEKLTPAKAQEMARSMMQGQGKDQAQKLAHELVDWSNRNRERVRELVQREVRSQLKNIGVATRDDLDALKRRVRDLERGGGAKKSTAKKPVAKKSTVKRSTAKASA